MARTLLLGSLLVGLAAGAWGLAGTTQAAERTDQSLTALDGVDDTDKTKDAEKKKKAKDDDKVTVWILDATGKG